MSRGPYARGVARNIGGWLDGPQSARGDDGATRTPGVRLGLPADGVGSIARFGPRIGAFLIDAVLSGGVALLFFGVPSAGDPPWSTVVFAVMYVITTALFGQTPGMRVLGLHVVRLDNGQPLGLWRAVARTLLLCLLIPALIADRDYRGMHDRAVDAAVLRAR